MDIHFAVAGIIAGFGSVKEPKGRQIEWGGGGVQCCAFCVKYSDYVSYHGNIYRQY